MAFNKSQNYAMWIQKTHEITIFWFNKIKSPLKKSWDSKKLQNRVKVDNIYEIHKFN